MADKTKKMRSSITFGDDGKIVVTNVAIGDANDQCHGDLQGFDEAMQEAGIPIDKEEVLATDTASAPQVALRKQAPTKKVRGQSTDAQAQQTVGVEGG